MYIYLGLVFKKFETVLLQNWLKNFGFLVGCGQIFEYLSSCLEFPYLGTSVGI